MNRKTRVGIIFGGRSGEHEVSVASAASVIGALDPEKYDILPIGITPEGRWYAGSDPRAVLGGVPLELATAEQPVIPVAMTGDPTNRGLIGSGGQQAALAPLDIVIPVLHGTFGEDGTMQGLLEMAGVAYAGCGVLGAALGMDKDTAKIVLRAVGLPVVDWIALRRRQFEASSSVVVDMIRARFPYPVFVKPANMGSSVGVGKAHDDDSLLAALESAFAYDAKVIVEPGVDCRELECGVLGNDEPQASVVGEVVPSNEFYDYKAKYVDNASRLYIPADLPGALADSIRKMAIEAFQALELSGLARVDFFLDRRSNSIYVNEVNTMPGFTQISMYPKLWEATGIPYSELLDRLITLGLERHAERERNRTRFEVEQ